MSPVVVRRTSVAVVALVLGVTGLSGAYRYWESYYQQRGFRTVALVAGARRGHLVTVNFHSAALGRNADYLVYLPPNYDPVRYRYPVYYLLHGSPGRPQVYIAIADMGLRLSNLISQHRIRPMILVYPDARTGGSTFSDSEWANTPSGRFESYLVEVVSDVDHHLATRANRGNRVIAGFSAGGYGATNIALHHLALFGNLQSWSGYYLARRTGVFAHASAAQLADNSPLDYVSGLTTQLFAQPLQAFLFVGRDDDVSPQTEPMAKALAAAGASVSYALYHGGHDWQLWHAHLNQMLILASRDVSAPLIRGSGTAGTLTPGVIPIPHGRGHHPTFHRRPGQRRRTHHRLTRLPRPISPLPPPFGPPPPNLPRASTGGGGVPTASLLLPQVARRIGYLRFHSPSGRSGLGLGALLGGLILALGSAAMINLGFLLQHRGLRQASACGTAPVGLAVALRRAMRSRAWLSGQLLGWIGFGAQIIAVAIAPLSLVQAFAAGGLALSVPLAASVFSHRISRSQVLAVGAIAAGLAVLPIGFGRGPDQLHAGTLAVSVAVVLLVASGIGAVRSAPLRAMAAGGFYGIADGAIKAVTLGWQAHGSSALISIWTPVAGLATFAGFIALQAALREHSPVSSISLMNALAALVALACGLIAFQESLGANAITVIAHLAAIALVLACVPVLAAAQAEMAQGLDPPPEGGAVSAPPLNPSYGSSGYSAADREEERLNPRASSGRPVKENRGEAQVTGQRVGRLGGAQQHQQAESRSDQRAPAGEHPDQR